MADETNNCPSCDDHSMGEPLPGNPNVLVRPYVPPTDAELELSNNFYAAMEARTGHDPAAGMPIQAPLPALDTSTSALIQRAMSGDGMLISSQLTAPWIELSDRADRLNPAHESQLVHRTASLEDLTSVAEIQGYLPTPFFPPWVDPDDVKDYWRLFAKALLRRRPITAKWADRRLNVVYEGLGTFLCEDIQAIQIIKRTLRGNRESVGLIPDDYPATAGGWVVDHNDQAASPFGWNCKKGQGCSPYYGDHVSRGWSRSKDATRYSLLDVPYPLAGRTDEFEVCFVCIVGGTFHSWLGCISGMKQETDLSGNVVRTDGTPTAAPSGEFLEALENFNEYYNGRRSATPGAPREVTPLEG